MSAAIARQWGRVQLEQSDLWLGFKMAKMVKGVSSRAAIEETKYLITNPRAEVWEEMKRGVEFRRHRKLKAAIERHPAMLCQNQTNTCRPCQIGTAKTAQTRSRHNDMGAPPPDWHWQPTPEQTAPRLGPPPAPPGEDEGAQRSQIDDLPPGYMYCHTSLPSTRFFDLDAYALDSQHDNVSNPDILTDDATSTG